MDEIEVAPDRRRDAVKGPYPAAWPTAKKRRRLALVVSHPIQYFAPLYQRLARRDDVLIKVFFTWHAGQTAVRDQGFGIPIAWDIPLTRGYDFELVANRSRDPGTHHFFGLRNPSLVRRIANWRPDAVHVTGWAWQSHLLALRSFARLGLPVLFRGDSHMLDEPRRGPRWWAKRMLLRRVYSWPAGFLVVGAANGSYYKEFGVTSERLFCCPHSIDVRRFSEPASKLEQQAAEWRRDLGIGADRCVLVYAGKFERKKKPLDLMRAVRDLRNNAIVLVMVGHGELEGEVRALAAENRELFIVLPFQNQSRMPLVYRLGELFVLPSAYGETWGLAVNEAMACGRAVLVSDRVGCAQDLVDREIGRVFSWEDPDSLPRTLRELVRSSHRLAAMGLAAARRAPSFDIDRTEEALIRAVERLCTE